MLVRPRPQLSTLAVRLESEGELTVFQRGVWGISVAFLPDPFCSLSGLHKATSVTCTCLLFNCHRMWPRGDQAADPRAREETGWRCPFPARLALSPPFCPGLHLLLFNEEARLPDATAAGLLTQCSLGEVAASHSCLCLRATLPLPFPPVLLHFCK